MNAEEAVEFLRPAVDTGCRAWADLGAGDGTFTRALATLLGAGGVIHAVDNDPAAVRALRDLRLHGSSADVIPVRADVADLSGSPELHDAVWDAVLLANVLHYFPDPASVLRDLTSHLAQHGRVVLIEYDRRSANPWVPHPIPLDRAPDVGSAAGLHWQGVVATRESRYQGTLYCAVLHRSES